MESTSIASYVCKVMSYSYQSKKWEFVGDRKEASRVEIMKKPKDNCYRIVGVRESDKIDTIYMEINKKLIVNLSVKTFVTLKGEYSTFGIQFKKENDSVDFLNKVNSIKSSLGIETPAMPPPIEDDNNRKTSPLTAPQTIPPAAPQTSQPTVSPIPPSTAPPTAPSTEQHISPQFSQPITPSPINNSQGPINKTTFQPNKPLYASMRKNDPAVISEAPTSTNQSAAPQAFNEIYTDVVDMPSPPSNDHYIAPTFIPAPPPLSTPAPPQPPSSSDNPTLVESSGDSLSSALAGIKLRKTTSPVNSSILLNGKTTAKNDAVEKPTFAPSNSGGADVMSEMQMKLLKRKNKQEAEARFSLVDSSSNDVNSANPPAPAISVKPQNNNTVINQNHVPNTFSLRPFSKIAVADSNNNKMDSNNKSNLSAEMSKLKEEIIQDIRKEIEIMKKEILEVLNK